MVEFVRREIEAGARGYFLYPVIDETEKQDVQAAVTAYETLSQGVYKDISMGLLHGRMKAEEKEE